MSMNTIWKPWCSYDYSNDYSTWHSLPICVDAGDFGWKSGRSVWWDRGWWIRGDGGRNGHKYATAQEAMKEYDDDMVRRGHIITTTNDEVEKIELLI